MMSSVTPFHIKTVFKLLFYYKHGIAVINKKTLKKFKKVKYVVFCGIVIRVFTWSCSIEEMSRPLIIRTWSPSFSRGVHTSAGMLGATRDTSTGTF